MKVNYMVPTILSFVVWLVGSWLLPIEKHQPFGLGCLLVGVFSTIYLAICLLKEEKE